MSNISKEVRVAVDTMGGDYAPSEIIKGAVMAARNDNIEIILVGPTDIVSRELTKYNGDCSYLPIRRVQADEVIKEGEHPALAIHHKPNASIVVAMELLKAGEADAVISAGPTGAVSVSAIRSNGLLPGIERPVVCVPLVGLAPDTVLVDGGANVDCKPQQLLSFAVIGFFYAKKLLNVSKPRVALLSTGSEEDKGSRLTQESYTLLRNSNLNFIGNIEGSDVLSGKANVIVCDGIVGNVLMKFYESMGHYIVRWLKGRLGNLPLVGPIKKLLNQMGSFTKMTSDESGGGGLLWGVNNVVQVLHGNSRAKQVSKAIGRAKYAVETDLIGCLKSELASIGGEHNICLNNRIRSVDNSPQIKKLSATR
jgi:glycerol-3-phosphate acyltransferase PlsX